MKNFINIKDISKKDLRKILTDAKFRKKSRQKLNTLDVDKKSPLSGKLLLQMFEKSSLRTRISFYLAIKQLGGSALTLRKDELHLGPDGENLSDVAKILSSYADGFILRTDSEKKLHDFAQNLKIPLINGLSPNSHPAQILSDIFTIEEIKRKPISKLNICWIGDSNNVLTSLIEASIKLNFKLNITCPKKYSPKQNLIKYIKKNKGKITISHNPLTAASNSDVLMTDKVISMNDNVNIKEKLRHFKNFKINEKLLKVVKKNCIILHCLPRSNEISDKVIFGKNSKVWQQAMNRVHVQKSILLYCFDKLR